MAELDNEKIIEHIKGMNVLDLNNLVKAIEEEFGVSASAAVAAGPAVAGPAGTAAEEKTEFNVVLESFGDKKVQVIKAVRELTSLGLKEAKELVDKCPSPVKEAVGKEEAEAAKSKLEEAGAQVQIK